MADRRRDPRQQADPFPGLVTALRREARGERPRFSADLHRRVLEAVVVPPMPDRAESPSRRASLAARVLVDGGLVVLVACVVIAVAAGRGGAERSLVTPVMGTASRPLDQAWSIEQFPLPEELGGRVIEQLAQLGAAAVGLPELSEIVPFDPTMLVAVDEAAIGRGGP